MFRSIPFLTATLLATTSFPLTITHALEATTQSIISPSPSSSISPPASTVLASASHSHSHSHPSSSQSSQSASSSSSSSSSSDNDNDDDDDDDDKDYVEHLTPSELGRANSWWESERVRRERENVRLGDRANRLGEIQRKKDAEEAKKNGQPDEDPEVEELSPFLNPPPEDPSIEKGWAPALRKAEHEATEANEKRSKEEKTKEAERAAAISSKNAKKDQKEAKEGAGGDSKGEGRRQLKRHVDVLAEQKTAASASTLASPQSEEEGIAGLQLSSLALVCGVGATVLAGVMLNKFYTRERHEYASIDGDELP